MVAPIHLKKQGDHGWRPELLMSDAQKESIFKSNPRLPDWSWKGWYISWRRTKTTGIFLKNHGMFHCLPRSYIIRPSSIIITHLGLVNIPLFMKHLLGKPYSVWMTPACQFKKLVFHIPSIIFQMTLYLASMKNHNFSFEPPSLTAPFSRTELHSCW